MQRDWSKIIIIILVAVIVIVSCVVTVLYLKTDLLKSKDLLFKKYISQNATNIAEVFDFEEENESIKLLQENDYSESADMTIKYLESKEDEEEEYLVKERGVSNKSQNAAYRKITATYDDEELLKVENLYQNNMYGIRLSNLVTQFVSVENSNLSYLISSLGYDGQYFENELKTLDLSEFAKFSDSEIEILTKKYMNAVFSDIDKRSFSTTRHSIITLLNGKSLTTTAYTLTINKNELDKMCRRVLNEAVNDEIILGKIEKIDERLKIAGFNAKEGESIKEIYTKTLKEMADGIEYAGVDNTKITIKVFELKGKTVRTDILTDTNEFIIDIAELENGKNILLKTIEFTDEGSNANIYSFSKEKIGNKVKRNFTYNKQELESLELGWECTNTEDVEINLNATYGNEKIAKLNIEGSMNFGIDKSKNIPNIYNEKNNIVLNNYDGDKIIDILKSLKSRQVKSLENQQSKLGTKLINNILAWIEQKEQEIEKEELNNAERQKKKFNNKFELYAGKDLSYEHVQKLLKVVSLNMSNYKMVDGNKLKINIENGKENIAKAEELSKGINDKHTYNVEMQYSEDGYVNSILISLYKK